MDSNFLESELDCHSIVVGPGKSSSAILYFTQEIREIHNILRQLFISHDHITQ